MTAEELRRLCDVLEALEVAEAATRLYLLGEAVIVDADGTRLARIQLNGRTEHEVTP